MQVVTVEVGDGSTIGYGNDVDGDDGIDVGYDENILKCRLQL